MTGSATTGCCGTWAPEMEPSDAADLVRHLLIRDAAAGTPPQAMTTVADAPALEDSLAPIRSSVGLRLEDVRINGARIDAVLESGDGHAWRVVVWTAGNPPRVENVTVFPRPPVFSPVAPGTVVVLNGPSSVGKSSLMTAFAERADTPWAYFDEPFLGRRPAEYLAWPDTAGPASEGTLAGIAAAASLGNQFLISAAGIPQAQFVDVLTGIPTVYVGLHAPLDVLIERQLGQRDKFGGLAEASFGIHEGWVYDLAIDTTARTPDQAAHDLAEFLAARSRHAQGDVAT